MRVVIASLYLTTLYHVAALSTVIFVQLQGFRTELLETHPAKEEEKDLSSASASSPERIDRGGDQEGTALMMMTARCIKAAAAIRKVSRMSRQIYGAPNSEPV